MKEQIKEKGLDNIDARVEDMAELSYENQSFDCVICFHTIYHTSYDGVVKALREINRVLKDKGEAFISFNTKDNPHYVKEKTVDGYTMIATEGHEAGIPHCYVDENDLFGLLQDFEILSMNKEINYVRKGKGTHGVHFYVQCCEKIADVFEVQNYMKSKIRCVFSCKQTYIHTSVGENQQKHVLKNLRYRSALSFYRHWQLSRLRKYETL